MNKEEAIERCNELIKKKHENWIGITNQIAIEMILNRLNELEKQQEKIEKLKTDYQILLDDLNDKRMFYVDESEMFDEYF